MAIIVVMCSDDTPAHHRHPHQVLDDADLPVVFDSEQVDSVTATTLMDTVTDIFMPDQGPAHRRRPFWAARQGPAMTMETSQAPEELLAERGFSVLVSAEKPPRRHTILFDAGTSPDGVVENMRRLEIDPTRWSSTDQALIVDVKDKGLLVITGRGHAGIVNICRYAPRLTNDRPLHAVIGGFHLKAPLFEPLIPRVLDDLAEMHPDVVVPAHCTGWRRSTPPEPARPGIHPKLGGNPVRTLMPPETPESARCEPPVGDSRPRAALECRASDLVAGAR